MNGLGIQMPESIEVDNTTFRATYGKFTIQPLERGYGTTIGNAIRRILLSSLPGAAITSIRISNVLHEFTTIPGVKEDLTEIVLALKEVRVKMLARRSDKMRLHLKGPKVFTAGDLQADTKEFEILNPEHIIAHLNNDAELDFEFTVKRGRGYVQADDNREPDTPLGTIPLDAIYTPIERVKFDVENTRVGQRIDYEKLTIEVWTDGSITPDDALSQAGKLLREHIQLFINFDVGPIDEERIGETDEDILRIRRLLRKPVDELELSVRSANCLKEAKIRTIADLVAREEVDMLKFKNFGRKSLNELADVLTEHGLHFGFDTEKYLGAEARRKAHAQL
ncbi:MAG: DNA-directed RNA polymerase subunit alpha [Calditrichaeota bacterium]|nr:DNA-directed RNA polymerase subunit alpha [Calditrichota bacterium]